MRYLVLYSLILLNAIIHFSCSSDQIDDGVKTIYFEGTEKVRQIINYANGYKNGPVSEFYENGKFKARQFYINDTLADSSITYHPNGKIKSVQIIKNKKANGRWLDFNKEGKLYKEVFFKDGVMDSTCTEYTYRTGKLLTRVNYRMGIKHGWQEEYYANGNPKYRIKFSNNSPVMGLQEWLENGKEINNDFKISISEYNDVLMKNTLTYSIRLQGAKSTDKVYQEVARSNNPDELGALYPLKETSGVHTLQFDIPKGGFVMKQITIVAERITDFGNTYIKKQTFNAASNNF